MTDHSTFLFLHFLLWHLYPSLSISHCSFVKNETVQWAKIDNSLLHLYLNNCGVKTIEYNGNNQMKLELLNLSSNQIETLPDQFLSDTPRDIILHLKNNQLNHLPDSILQNKKLTICSLDCIFMKNFSKWPSNKTCEDIFKECRSGSALVLVILTLLLAILVLGALGLAWYWKSYRYTSHFALPKFLHKRKNQNDSDPPHIPCNPSEYTGTKHFPPCQIKDKPSAQSRDNTDQSYENVETGPARRAEEHLTDLYENTAQFNSEEHLYGNESSTEYYNFQKPHCLNTPSDEDIYVLPD
ncbi:protein GAPT [Petaurus breviceps papuanus]|uniref:protein GAPT n=1 Tax=Petaurus breviceps papuanus TaxID=3040969 RepID=UPI0036D8CEB0